MLSSIYATEQTPQFSIQVFSFRREVRRREDGEVRWLALYLDTVLYPRITLKNIEEHRLSPSRNSVNPLQEEDHWLFLGE